MLKISVRDRKARRLLVLEGKLVAPWTDELRCVCQSIASDTDQREIVIDLRGVTDVSSDGEDTLLCLMISGAKFRGSGIFMKQVLKQLARRVPRNDGV